MPANGTHITIKAKHIYCICWIPHHIRIDIRTVGHAEGVAGKPAAGGGVVVAVGGEVEAGLRAPVVAGELARGDAGVLGVVYFAVGRIIEARELILGLIVDPARRAEMIVRVVAVGARGGIRPVDMPERGPPRPLRRMEIRPRQRQVIVQLIDHLSALNHNKWLLSLFFCFSPALLPFCRFLPIMDVTNFPTK